jgi:tRNA(adenine34) deaminase
LARQSRLATQEDVAVKDLDGMLSSSMDVTPATSRRVSAKAQLALDEERMAALAAFTARSMKTDQPIPFGSSIYHTKSGAMLLQTLNAVAKENDPSSHAEVKAIRLAAKKLKNPSLAGYTLYTTCEPCPMCMSAVLWANLGRVVYGATIEDASNHCNQIHIHAVEVAERSDMACQVVGPVLREQCYALFKHPNMLRAFSTWTTRRTKPRTKSQE